MYVKEGDDLCEVADISTMKAVVSIDEGEMGYLSHGDPAELRVLSAPGVLLTGKVKRFSPVADSGSGVMRNFLATIEVKNRDHLLRSGMEGVAKIRTARIRPIHYVAWRLARIIRVDLWF
jgi:HlyD family secretion protein